MADYSGKVRMNPVYDRLNLQPSTAHHRYGPSPFLESTIELSYPFTERSTPLCLPQTRSATQPGPEANSATASGRRTDMTERREFPPDEEKATMGASVDLERDVEKSSSAPLMAEVTGQLQESVKHPRGSMATVIDLGCILLNIVSTVLLVFVNKWYVSLAT